MHTDTHGKIPIYRLALILLAWACGAYAGGEPCLRLRVSRDFRTPPIMEKSARCSGQSVMKLLKESAAVETAFGGEFVQSIDGMTAGKGGDSRRSWIYYVNGLIAEVGAAQRVPECGDCVVWDLHTCDGPGLVTGLIGCFPQPFPSLQKRGGAPLLVLHDAGSRDAAIALARSLERQGVKKTSVQSIAKNPIPGGAASIVIGSWEGVIRNETLKQIYERRGAGGIFVEFNKGGLSILSQDCAPRKFLPHAGVILAARAGGAPLWIVSGTDRERTMEAAGILIREPERIRGMASAAVSGGKIYPVPLMDAFNE